LNLSKSICSISISITSQRDPTRSDSLVMPVIDDGKETSKDLHCTRLFSAF